MFIYLSELPEPVSYGIVMVVGLLLLFIGWKVAGLMSWYRYRKEIKKSSVINEEVNKGIKKIWDEEKIDLEKRIVNLHNQQEITDRKLEEYRRKLAGLGIIDWLAKKRKQVMYSLLLENEALEALLREQGRKLTEGKKDKFKEQLLKTQKKGKFFGVLSDNRVKQYIESVLVKEKVKGKLNQADNKNKPFDGLEASSRNSKTAEISDSPKKKELKEIKKKLNKK